MPSQSETGHAKNVANFETLISYCIGYGATYAPSNAALSIVRMQAQLANARIVLNTCKNKQTIFDNATDVRKDAFAVLRPLSTRIVKALSVSGVPDSIVDGAKTINRKIQGQRANPLNTTALQPTPSDDNAPSNHSVSQLSYDYMLEHLNAMVELVSSHTEYNPNEADLAVRTLQTLQATLRTANTEVINTHTDWSNARVARQTTLYADTTGLVATALKAKNYVCSIFAATSLQYKQVKGISFRSIKG